MYSTFLAFFPVKLFSFIGITEFYGEEYRRLKSTLLPGLVDSIYEENVTDTTVCCSYKDTIDVSLRKQIEDYHRKDMDLYNWALEVREKALARF
jgi:hypothetical protein